MFGRFKKGPPDPPERFPPVPAWQPPFDQPLDRVVERVRRYTNGARDFAVFRHGTVAILSDGLSEAGAEQSARAAIHAVFHFHPDMNPLPMDDGNILVQYGHDVNSVVLSDVVLAYREVIDRNHLSALTPGEVLFTPLGPNTFDEFGKAALFGRCYLFMDAQAPDVVAIERKAA